MTSRSDMDEVAEAAAVEGVVGVLGPAERARFAGGFGVATGVPAAVAAVTGFLLFVAIRVVGDARGPPRTLSAGESSLLVSGLLNNRKNTRNETKTTGKKDE